MKNREIKELRNEQDFKDFYLNENSLTFCEECVTVLYESGNGFLEIAQLESLKRQQKNRGGSRRGENFTAWC